jgi:hypothetical protein
LAANRKQSLLTFETHGGRYLGTAGYFSKIEWLEGGLRRRQFFHAASRAEALSQAVRWANRELPTFPIVAEGMEGLGEPAA